MPDTATTELQLTTVDPTRLGVLDQARADATPDPELVASVKQHGILQPPTVTWNDDHDGYVIVTGHRRVGAAIQAGLTEVPVIVRSGALADEAVKLEQQIVENERRKGLTAKELAQGYQKLQLFGRTPEDIAREIAEKPERVRAGLKIVASEKASTLVDTEPSIDFEQAAIIAEFDEHPKLQRKLIETATTNPANFQRDVASSRTQREVDARVATLKAKLDAEDVALADVLTYGADWWTGKGASPGKGKTLDKLGINRDDHADCPGHAAVIHKAQAYYLADQPSSWILYVCTDWEANGHTPTEREKDPEQLAREAEWARQAEERRKHQELVNANTTARRGWLHGHLSTGRLRPTADHLDLLATALSVQIRYSDFPAPHLTLQLLDGTERTPDTWNTTTNADELAALAESGRAPLRVVLASAIATFEDALEVPEAVRYFAFLEVQGYTLTDSDREHLAQASAEGDVDGNVEEGDE